MIIASATITAYCACRLCCGPRASGVCADGSKPVQGITVAAPRRVPLGTRIEIGGQRFVVRDRLARRYDDRWDVYFVRHQDAKRFGVKKLTVRVLK